MGVVTSKSRLSLQQTAAEAAYHRCWYPVALSAALASDRPLGRDFLGSRVVAWRDPGGRAVVQTAWCPHLGADLSVGQIADGRLRCSYHHWSFDGSGRCAHIPSGDKVPAGARIFTYPTQEAWSLVWAFNGEHPDCDPPRIPDADETTIAFEVRERGRRSWDTWVAVSNGVDFQHLQTLHGIPRVSMPSELQVEASGIEFDIESPYHRQHGRISGTNVFAQHLRMGGADLFMMFCGAPIEPGKSSGFLVVGVPKDQPERLPGVLAMAERLNDEDAPVLSSMRFRRGLLTASDRHLATYFKYVENFPCFAPPQ
ncbi:MAG: Rieske 2Fe-2S domain-containing protein [Alphaproteobacteria bacterium]|nr:Rieske 2Fe-2S domain-containing protein [Alphaproteobacteria bacterium]